MRGEDLALQDGIVDSSWFEEITRGPEPYSSEIKEPVTLLDRMVYGAIMRRGNDNVLPEADPYDRSLAQRTLHPGAQTMGDGGKRLQFGEDYLTHHTPLRRLSVAKVIGVYNKQFGHAKVIVDDFMHDSGGGLAARTTFGSTEDKPEVIYKARQTDFLSFLGNMAVHTVDFRRELKQSEKTVLGAVLETPGMLTEHEDYLAVEARQTRQAFYELVGENTKEAKMRRKGEKEFEKEMEEHQKFMEQAARMHVVPSTTPYNR